MTTQINTTKNAIDHFAQIGDIGDLRSAMIALNALSFETSVPMKDSDEIAISLLWLELFKNLDGKIAALKADLQLPSSGIQPQALRQNDPPLMPNVPPSEVKNAKQRAAYEEAIANNKRKIAQTTQYGELSYAEIQATSYFSTWAGPRYRNNPDMQLKITASAQKAHLEPDRLAKISEAVGVKSSELNTSRLKATEGFNVRFYRLPRPDKVLIPKLIMEAGYQLALLCRIS